MFAIEFQAKVKKNGTIEIPVQYRDKLKEIVRVIVLTEGEQKTSNLIDQLLEKPFEAKGFRPLTRDEIYG